MHNKNHSFCFVTLGQKQKIQQRLKTEMDIAIKDLITPIIMLMLGGVNIAIIVSKMTTEQVKTFNSIKAQAIELILFWSVIGISIFQIASEVLSSDPISRLVIFKIALYFFFITVIVLFKVVGMFLSRFREVYIANTFQVKHLDAQGESINDLAKATYKLSKIVLNSDGKDNSPENGNQA